MGRSNLSGATLKKQSRRYVNPDATQTDLGPGAQPWEPRRDWMSTTVLLRLGLLLVGAGRDAHAHNVYPLLLL